MCVGYLQVTPCNAGRLLLGFLWFYGVHFDYQSVGIDCRGRGSMFWKEDIFSDARVDRLYLLDPLDGTRNLAR